MLAKAAKVNNETASKEAFEFKSIIVGLFGLLVSLFDLKYNNDVYKNSP
jgi:hypothetical protein